MIHELAGDRPVAPLNALGRLVDVLALVLPGEAAQWRFSITVAWLALASADAIRTGVGQERASASAGLVGLGAKATAAVAIPLPNPPAVVRQELNTAFSSAFSSGAAGLEVKHALAYLTGKGASFAYSLVPGLREMLAPLMETLGLRLEQLLDAALVGALGTGLGATNLYRNLRVFARTTIDNSIQGRLLPELRRLSGDTAESSIWIDEVAEPSLGLLSNFVFDRLDALVGGRVAVSDVSPFMASFRSALCATMSELFARNVVVVSDLVREQALVALQSGLRTLATGVRRAPDHAAAKAARELARSLLPPLLPVPRAYPQIGTRCTDPVLPA